MAADRRRDVFATTRPSCLDAEGNGESTHTSAQGRRAWNASCCSNRPLRSGPRQAPPSPAGRR